MKQRGEKLKISDSPKKNPIGLYLFIFGLIVQYLWFIDNKIRYGNLPDAIPFLYGALGGITIILIDFYGLVLSIYYIFKKYPRILWLPPLLNFLGLISLIGILILESLDLLYLGHRTYFYSYHILKIIGLFLALRVAIINKKILK